MAKKKNYTADGSDGSNAGRTQLRAFIERIERLEEEKKTVADDIKNVYGEAKETGFDTKIMKKVIAIRKMDRDERMEQESVLETYLTALGMSLHEPADDPIDQYEDLGGKTTGEEDEEVEI